MRKFTKEIATLLAAVTVTTSANMATAPAESANAALKASVASKDGTSITATAGDLVTTANNTSKQTTTTNYTTTRTIGTMTTSLQSTSKDTTTTTTTAIESDEEIKPTPSTEKCSEQLMNAMQNGADTFEVQIAYTDISTVQIYAEINKKVSEYRTNLESEGLAATEIAEKCSEYRKSLNEELIYTVRLERAEQILADIGVDVDSAECAKKTATINCTLNIEQITKAVENELVYGIALISELPEPEGPGEVVIPTTATTTMPPLMGTQTTTTATTTTMPPLMGTQIPTTPTTTAMLPGEEMTLVPEDITVGTETDDEGRTYNYYEFDPKGADYVNYLYSVTADVDMLSFNLIVPVGDDAIVEEYFASVFDNQADISIAVPRYVTGKIKLVITYPFNNGATIDRIILSRNESTETTVVPPRAGVPLPPDDYIEDIPPVEGVMIAPTTSATEPEALPPLMGDVAPYIYGDANNDSVVSIADAATIMQYISNPDKYAMSDIGKINADVVGGNNGITADDALAIQKYDAKLVDSIEELMD